MKEMRTLDLVGILADGKEAKTSDAANVVHFADKQGHVQITKMMDSDNPDYIKMVTSTGIYRLPKHATLNYYHGVCNGVKVQVHLKKVVGTVRYWS